MQVEGAVALVTGANRGLGRAFARALLDAGAAKVYAGARDPGTITDPDVVPLRLDVTDPAQVAAAAEVASDVNIVINNAGVELRAPLLGDDLGPLREEFEVNYFGTLAVARAFAPVLAANGGGALVNMLSALSFVAVPRHPNYSATKAAAWSLTNSLRTFLRGQGTLVVGVHAGYLDTDMTADIDDPKIAPEVVATQTVEALAAGSEEVLADDTARTAKAALPRDLELVYPGIQARYDEAVAAASSQAS
jgi:NAD(P)-dependent dehydrogenase (short-subunit alcohol dehydrogenase family)